MRIPLTPVQRAARARIEHDAPYRAFIFGSLLLGVGGGFMLAVLLPLAQALDWDWGRSWPALAQVHGQLQLLGFAGLFVMGMSFRLLPRFGGRPLAYPPLVRAVLPLVASSLVLRSVAQPAGEGVPRDAGLIASAALLVAGAAAFAAVIGRTVVHPASKAEATGYFFVLGALGYLGASLLNLLLVVDMVRDGLALAPLGRQPSLLFLQLYGFVLMFISGVGTRAVPSFTGRPRPDLSGRIAAVVLALGVAMFTGASLWLSHRATTAAMVRVEDAGLLVAAAAFVAVAWLAGVFHPAANRVAAASWAPFQFVRAAFIWLAVAAALTGWYAVPAFRDRAAVDVFEVDAIRHTLTVGVVTMMIVGIGMLIVPEFAGRRLQHPGEDWIAIAMLVALNSAVVLRIWPPIEGLNWTTSTRYWPMVAAGALASAVVLVFGLMFLQSYLEQRQPGWGSRDALAGRGATRS